MTAEETIEPIRRLMLLAAAKSFPLVPSHDPVVWPTLTDELVTPFGR